MKINLALLLLTVLIFSACGGNQKKSRPAVEQPSKTDIKIEPSPTAADHPGRQVYNSVCLACHMADGSGVPGMHPPLIETDWVTGDKVRLVKLVLEGMSGKIEVDGEIYNSIMPPHAHLSDQQIADVLSYIRMSFGNNASVITTEEVQKVRNSN